MLPHDELTPPERRLGDAFPAGTTVDLRTGSADRDLPESGASWGQERTIRAEVLRALLLVHPSTDGEVARVELRGARISGRLDLRHARVRAPVALIACHFDEAPDLYAAHLDELHLWQSSLPGLSATGARFDGFVALTECHVTGMVSFNSARFGRTLFLDHARVTAADHHEHGVAVALNHCVVDDAVVATGLTARGEVRLDGATVAAQVALERARLLNAGGIALNAEGLSTGSHLLARELRAQGRIALRGARIPRQLDLAEARLSDPGGVALQADSAAIGEVWLRGAAAVQGAVHLRGARLDVLHAEPAVWPGEVRLLGLAYTALLPPLPAAQRLPLLERDAYAPQPYEQLAAAYRRVGDDAGARTVQLARLRRHRASLPGYARAWSRVQDVTVGYGYRPLRAAAWFAALLLLGTLAFAAHHPAPLKDTGTAPAFNPLVYTLDLLLPVVGFGQRGAYAPGGGWQWLAYGLILSGWLLATTIVAGVTRALSRA